MANRRKTPKSKRKKTTRSPKPGGARQIVGTIAAPREAIGVILSCVGIITLLSLGSFEPGDISLNENSCRT